MGQPVVQTVTGVGVSTPVVLDTHLTPFNVGVTVYCGSGCTYTVQYTVDNPLPATGAFTPSSATWIDHPDTTGGATASTTVQFATPVRAIRLNQSAGAAATTMTTIQAGISN